MTSTYVAMAAVVLGAIGTYLLLPQRHGRLRPRAAHVVGGLFTAVAALMLAFGWTRPAEPLPAVFFYIFGLAAVGGGVMTITSRNPIYSALWFASVVLSTSGLFLLAGAQFLAAGTVIVYAGAIIVTFLFVIMLAQAGGRAAYDRSARAPGRATLSCFLLLWSLVYGLSNVGQTIYDPTLVKPERAPRVGPAQRLASFRQANPADPGAVVLDRTLTPTVRIAPVAQRHIAGLGGTLYTDYLLAAEIAGAILFVALVGTAAIATPRPPIRPVPATPPGRG